MQVQLQSCGDYTPQSCRHALEAMDFSWVRPGMRIGIKANLVSAMEPETAATTHPALLTALTVLLRERGAQVVIGDSPGGLYNAAHLERVYSICGLHQARAAGAELNMDFSVREGSFPAGDVLHRFSYTGWLAECDEIINFCKLKTHGMMAMTCVVKNFFGTIPGTRKPEYHYRFPEPERFASMLIDLQLFWKARLHLVDAVEAMEGNGPTAGVPRHLGLVLGCENPFALDQVCAQLIGLKPEQVPTLRVAQERQLIPAYRVSAPVAPYCVSFRTPPTRSLLFGHLLPGKAGALLGRTIGTVLASRPALNAQACIGCGKCAGICPAHAITMKNNRPWINRRQCIRCFCCQEFCPAGALEARRPLAARLLTK